MCRFLLYIALALYFSGLAAIAADRYGGWLLEQPQSSVLTLSFKRSLSLNNKIDNIRTRVHLLSRKSIDACRHNTHTF